MTTDTTLPIAFDATTGPKLMTLFGYTVTHHEATWEDVGGPESGPKLVGCPAHDEWTRSDGHYVIVADGEIVDIGQYQPTPDGYPF
jgi:hypothetical protein